MTLHIPGQPSKPGEQKPKNPKDVRQTAKPLLCKRDVQLEFPFMESLKPSHLGKAGRQRKI